MDVVYVIGTGSKWDNNELRYSLRSIEKFASGLGEVYIVGDELPEFINPETVKFLRCYDLPGYSPARNVYRKLKALFSATDIEQFLLSSDDHFFIKRVDFNNWPIHWKGDSMPKKGSTGVGDKRYTQTMVDTRQFMAVVGLDLKYYEGHTNKLYTRWGWDYLQKQGIDSWMHTRSTYGLSLNSPMAATIMQFSPYRASGYRKDVKLHHLNTETDWGLLKGAESFSIYDSAIDTGVAGFLQVMFPEPSRFEKI